MEILFCFGILSLIGGVISGAALFFRAVAGKKESAEGPGMGTLWGLFIILTALGIILVASTGSR
jgi:hypothetical protein